MRDAAAQHIIQFLVASDDARTCKRFAGPVRGLIDKAVDSEFARQPNDVCDDARVTTSSNYHDLVQTSLCNRVRSAFGTTVRYRAARRSADEAPNQRVRRCMPARS